MTGPVRVYSRPDLENASLIVGWLEDVGKVGPRVIEYLKTHISAKMFCEIEPEKFFPLDGVAVIDDVAQFPMSKFFVDGEDGLVLFESNQPLNERYKFLNDVLDVGQYYCKIKELYTIGGIISPIAHTSPRRLLSVFNQSEFHDQLRGFELEDMAWEGSPAINSFLLWAAQQRNIPGLSLWSEVAFYLAAVGDSKAAKSALSFFNRRFDLGLDFTALDSEIEAQDDKLATLRRENPEIDKYIRTLEVGLSLNEDEQLKLAQGVAEFLEKDRI